MTSNHPMSRHMFVKGWKKNSMNICFTVYTTYLEFFCPCSSLPENVL